MNRRLHEVAADFLALESLMIEAGGEVTPEVEAWMAENSANLETKVDGYAALIAEWEADVAKWKAEEARVAAHRKAMENAAARLKARLVGELVAMDQLKVETPRFKVAVQRAASTVEVLVDASVLPPQFRREIPATIEADKVALRQALKLADNPSAGELTVDGLTLARLNPGTPYLVVR